MEKQFTKQFMLDNRGCYSPEKMESDVLKGRAEVSYLEILETSIPIKDKYWFFCRKIFTKKENQLVAIAVAELVLPIYEAKYPNSKAPREAIEAAKLYITGHISLNELLLKRRAAYAAADAAYAAAYAADAAAADAAADAAYAAADAAAAYADAAAAAAYADAAAAVNYSHKLWEFLKDFIESN